MNCLGYPVQLLDEIVRVADRFVIVQAVRRDLAFAELPFAHVPAFACLLGAPGPLPQIESNEEVGDRFGHFVENDINGPVAT